MAASTVSSTVSSTPPARLPRRSRRARVHDAEPVADLVEAAPFLKWAGGKRQLVGPILALIPAAMETYHEPFVGGGAVFFALAVEGRFRHAVLSDANDELIVCYQAVKRDVSAVIGALSRHHYDQDHYYSVRAQIPTALAPAERAARLIYLNKTGFNGLYRVNSAGLFNVPFGRHHNPMICDQPRLRAAAAALQRAEIVRQDFAEAMAAATPDDFVYLDPPYVAVSRTASFTAYAQGRFGADEQERLAKALRALRKRRVRALLSNSDCDETARLYKGLPLRRVAVRRNINSAPQGRGPVGELLVRSFAYRGAC